MTTLDKTPSAIARATATQLWGGSPNNTYRIGKKAWGYSMPGHGGIVMLADSPELEPGAIDRLPSDCRETLVVIATRYRFSGEVLATRSYLKSHIDSASLAAVSPAFYREYPVLIGEEDCAWAPLVLAAPKLAEGIAGNYHSTTDPAEVLDHARQSAARWYPEAVAS